jgi:hypothetical protein
LDTGGNLIVGVYCRVFSGRDIPLAEFLYPLTHQAATDRPGSRRIDKARRAAIAAEVIAGFRGRYALRFLGLDSSAPNNSGRKRLASFYKNNNLFRLLGDDKPVWC